MLRSASGDLRKGAESRRSPAFPKSPQSTPKRSLVRSHGPSAVAPKPPSVAVRHRHLGTQMPSEGVNPITQLGQLRARQQGLLRGMTTRRRLAATSVSCREQTSPAIR
jgi:hypothetical protein